jgi:glycosyltransferase involved in cell wall biosynthesis
MQPRRTPARADAESSDARAGAPHFDVSLVLPVQSEAGRLGKVLTRLVKLIRSTGWTAELIVVDDASQDGCGEAAARWKVYFNELGVVRHACRKGRGVAARTGALLARGRYVVLLDARSETAIEDAVQLVDCLARGADVAVDSRHVFGTPTPAPRSFLERASETTFLALSKLMVPVDVRDSCADLIAFRRNALRNIAQRARVEGEAFAHEWLALAGRLGFQVIEVPASMTPIDAEERARPNELAKLRDLWKLRKRLSREEAPQASAAHQLLHETGFVRIDRRKFLSSPALDEA